MLDAGWKLSSASCYIASSQKHVGKAGIHPLPAELGSAHALCAGDQVPQNAGPAITRRKRSVCNWKWCPMSQDSATPATRNDWIRGDGDCPRHGVLAAIWWLLAGHMNPAVDRTKLLGISRNRRKGEFTHYIQINVAHCYKRLTTYRYGRCHSDTGHQMQL